MKFSLKLIFVLVILTLIPTMLTAKPRVGILYFEGWNGTNGQNYDRTIRELILSKLVKTHKFEVVDRDKLEALLREQNLQHSGAVIDTAVVKIGKLLGVDFFIVGSFTGNQSTYHSAEYSEAGRKLRDAFTSASVSITARTLLVESGRFQDAFELSDNSVGATESEAYTNSVTNLAQSLVDELGKITPIFLQSGVNENKSILLEKGSKDGLFVGQYFALFDTPFRLDITKRKLDRLKPICFVRISSVTESSARATLLKNAPKNLSPTNTLMEWFSGVNLSAKISKIVGNKLILNVGVTSGVQNGTTFSLTEKSKEIVDEETQEVLGVEEVKSVHVVVTKVKPKYCYAKVFEGNRSVSVGQLLKKSNKATTALEGFIGFGHSLSVIEPQATFPTALSISSLNSINLAIGARDLKTNIFYSAKLNIYLRKQKFGAGILAGEAGYDFYIVPAKFFITPGISLGLGVLSQEPPNNVVKNVLDGNSDRVRDWGLYAGTFLKIQYLFKSFGLYAKISGQYLEGHSWEYTYDTYGSGSDSRNIDRSYLEYSNAIVGPLSVSGGVSIDIMSTLR